MSRWGKPTKNKRRGNPRYHLKEYRVNPNLAANPAFSDAENARETYDYADYQGPMTLPDSEGRVYSDVGAGVYSSPSNPKQKFRSGVEILNVPPPSPQQESRDISRFKQLAGVVSESPPGSPLVVSITDEGFPFAHHESVPEEEPPPSAAELHAGEPEGRVPNPRTSWEDPNELRPGIPGVQGSREPNVELQDKQHAQQWESKARLNQMIKEELGKLMEEFEPESSIPAQYDIESPVDSSRDSLLTGQLSDIGWAGTDHHGLTQAGAIAGGLAGLSLGGGSALAYRDNLETNQQYPDGIPHPEWYMRTEDPALTAIGENPVLGTALSGLTGAALGGALGYGADRLAQGVRNRRARRQGDLQENFNQMIKEEFTKLMEVADTSDNLFAGSTNEPPPPEPEAVPLPLEIDTELEEVPDVPDPENTNEPPPEELDEVPPEEPSGFGESQDPFKRIRDLALKPYGSCKSEGEK